MRVKLTRGNRRREVELTDIEAQWLIDHGYAEKAASKRSKDASEPSEGGDEDALDNASLNDLQAIAEEQGLATYGTKAQLKDRIRDHQRTVTSSD